MRLECIRLRPDVDCLVTDLMIFIPAHKRAAAEDKSQLQMEERNMTDLTHSPYHDEEKCPDIIPCECQTEFNLSGFRSGIRVDALSRSAKNS